MTAKKLFEEGMNTFSLMILKKQLRVSGKVPRSCTPRVLRVADEVCRNYLLFDLDHDLERTWEPVTFPEDRPIDWECRQGNNQNYLSV